MTVDRKIIALSFLLSETLEEEVVQWLLEELQDGETASAIVNRKLKKLLKLERQGH